MIVQHPELLIIKCNRYLGAGNRLPFQSVEENGETDIQHVGNKWNGLAQVEEPLTQGEEDAINDIFNNHNTLTIEVDKPIMLADNSDTVTISYDVNHVDNVAYAAGDTKAYVTVMLDGEKYTERTLVNLTGGVVNMPIQTQKDGRYKVFIERYLGSHTGVAEFLAIEE